MTLDDLEKAKGAAARRLELCAEVRLIEDNFIHQGQMLTLTGRMPEPRLFGLELDDQAVAAVRAALIGDRVRRIATAETLLRSLGVTFPGDPVTGVEPTVPVTISVNVDTIGTEMCAADVERIRAASRAADDGYRAGA